MDIQNLDRVQMSFSVHPAKNEGDPTVKATARVIMSRFIQICHFSPDILIYIVDFTGTGCFFVAWACSQEDFVREGAYGMPCSWIFHLVFGEWKHFLTILYHFHTAVQAWRCGRKCRATPHHEQSVSGGSLGVLKVHRKRLVNRSSQLFEATGIRGVL